MSTRRSPALAGPSKKISSWVRPGVCEVRARLLRPVSALMREDLPTLDRPAKATSVAPIGGSISIEGAAWVKRHSPANSFRPASISSLSISAAMRKCFFASWPGLSRPPTSTFLLHSNVDARHMAGHDEIEAILCGGTLGYVAFLGRNKPRMLLKSSTLTPLRRMMTLCWVTDSVLFQAQ